MNRLINFSLLLVSLLIFIGVPDECRAENLRLLTYNVRNGKGLDNQCDYKRVGEIIRQSNADVVAVQELDSATNRSGGKDVLSEIALHAGMNHIYAPAISYDGGAYGIGILCRELPLSVSQIKLPGREEERTLVVVEFDNYMFACTHLSLTEEDRMLSIPLITEMAQSSEKPFFMAGDFNAHPEDEFMKELAKYFTAVCETQAMSFPADNPDERLDYIVVFNRDSSLVKPVRSQVLNQPVASDHRPVMADVELKNK